LGREVGSVSEAEWSRFQRKEEGIADLFAYLRGHRHGSENLEKWLRRTDIDWEDLCGLHPVLKEWDARADVVEQVVLECKYAGYIGRQAEQVERFQAMESRTIPATFDYLAIPQLRCEAREKLSKVRPANIGQAGRVSGITPADLAVLLLYLR
jgi:tRNA uridine 5-carboxymethylaminomethyl modification enzyme